MLKDPEKLKNFGETGTAMHKEYHEFSQTCKQFAEGRRNKSPYSVDRIPDMLEKLEGYVEKQEKIRKPLTIGGFALALGIPTRTFNKLCNGDYDYVVEEYRILNDLPMDCMEHNGIPLIPFSEIMDKCKLLIQEQLETNCYQNRGNPAGSIFALKCRFDWVEDASPNTVNQTLVIADSSQAMKAIEMLKNE